ncbi:hypothetical protein EV122DRAFT_284342 [Schizophyllum commune]
MGDLNTPCSPSEQSFDSRGDVSAALTSTPESPVPERAAPRVEHEDTAIPVLSHRFYLDDGTLKLELDNGTLYNVHRYFFERHAPLFAEKYLRGEHVDTLEV